MGIFDGSSDSDDNLKAMKRAMAQAVVAMGAPEAPSFAYVPPGSGARQPVRKQGGGLDLRLSDTGALDGAVFEITRVGLRKKLSCYTPEKLRLGFNPVTQSETQSHPETHNLLVLPQKESLPSANGCQTLSHSKHACK